MKENRKGRRTLVTGFRSSPGSTEPCCFEIRDRTGSRLFGYMLDITVEGFRVISTEQMPQNVVYELTINLPRPIDGNDCLFVDARSVWSRRDGRTGMYHTGYQILNAPTLTVEVIEKLITELEGQDIPESRPSTQPTA